MKGIRTVSVIVIAWVLAGCSIFGGDTSDNQGDSRGALVSAASFTPYSQAAISAILDDVGLGAIVPVYPVRCFRLVYRTPAVTGELLDASGLLCAPQKPPGTPSPILSYQHGTIFLDVEAPTSLIAMDYVLGQAFAALGYIAVLPDYVGYGASSDRPHPYLHASTMASATVDMVRAARTFARQNNIALNDKLFLAGYSEGGYATLAAQREMEQQLAGEVVPTASAPGAGPYDLSGTAQTLLAGATLDSPAYVAFFVRAYDGIYHTPTRLAQIFRAPYDEVVANTFNGDTDRATISASLTAVTADLFNEPFLLDFRGSGELALKASISANNIYQWQPKTPTHFFHGVDDEVVPFANATTAVSAMQSSGSASLITCNAGGQPTTHSNCAAPYVLYMLGFFGSFAPGL